MTNYSFLNLLQVQTNKHIKFGMWGTQIFWTNLMMDLNLDGQIELKNSPPKFFPLCFGYAKFFDPTFWCAGGTFGWARVSNLIKIS